MPAERTLLCSAMALLFLEACATKPNPDYCDEETPCMSPATPFCDTTGAFPASDGVSNSCIPTPDEGDDPIDTPSTTGDGDGDGDGDSEPETRTLTIALADSSKGVVSGPDGLRCDQAECAVSLPVGASVELVAEPRAENVFVEWSGPCTGFGVCNVTLSEDTRIEATFAAFRDELDAATIRGETGSLGLAGFVAGGGIVLSSAFEGTVRFGDEVFESEATSGLILRLDSAGELVWSKQIGVGSGEIALPSAITPDGDILVGDAVSGEILRLDGATGATVWSIPIRVRNGSLRFTDFKLGVSNDFVCGIAFDGALDVGGGFVDVANEVGRHIAWFSQEGKFLRENTIVTSFAFLGPRLAVNANGEVFASGSFNADTIDFDRDTPDGVVATPVSEKVYAYVAKYSQQAALRWSTLIGAVDATTDGNFFAFSLPLVAALPNGDVLFAGSARGAISLDGSSENRIETRDADIFFARYSGPSGAFASAVRFPSEDSSALFASDYTTGLAIDARGRVTVAGAFEETLVIEGQALSCRSDCVCGFAMTLDPDTLAPLWSAAADSLDAECRNSTTGLVAVDHVGRLALILNSQGNVRIGNRVIDSGAGGQSLLTFGP